jgi:hypothetical protein
MLDLVKEILNHSLCQASAMVSKQTADDEIAVPAVHFVELAARDYVRVLEIKQPVPLYLGHGLLQNHALEMFDIDTAVLLHFAEAGGSADISGEIQNRLAFGLDVFECFAIRQRALQIVPAIGNVLEDVIERLERSLPK